MSSSPLSPPDRCKNCGHTVTDNYCPNCGQSTQTKRISLSELFHDFSRSVFFLDKGLLYTSRELTLRPGPAIRGYLAGKRVSLQKSFDYLFSIVAIYLFVIHFFIVPPVQNNQQSSTTINPITNETTIAQEDDDSRLYTAWILDHFTLLMACTLPLSALFTFWLYRKSGYNYGENLIINAYALGLRLLLVMLLLPVKYLLNDSPTFGTIQRILTYIVFFSIIVHVFNGYTWWQHLLRIIAYILLLVIVFISICLALVWFEIL